MSLTKLSMIVKCCFLISQSLVRRQTNFVVHQLARVSKLN